MRRLLVGSPPRARLFELALFASAAAVLLLPLACDSSPGAPGTIRMPSLALTVSAAPAVRAARMPALSRDPFDHGLPVRASSATAGESFHEPEGTSVLAVATGTIARALVEEGGVRRVVAVGDRVNGARIATILPEGLRLENGAFVALEPRP